MIENRRHEQCLMQMRGLQPCDWSTNVTAHVEPINAKKMVMARLLKPVGLRRTELWLFGF